MQAAQAETTRPEAAIRAIRPGDNAALASVIRAVLPQFGRTGPGTALNDPEVDRMYEAYSQPRCLYLVVEREGAVVGGAGIAPLKGGDAETCELQKTYLLEQVRGQGLGSRMIGRCLEEAVRLGFRRCYLETFAPMDVAQAVYQSLGFRPINAPLGATGHYQCDRWYVKEL